ncbi:alpha/beta fold hydrolase [soil metagenome]
MKGERIISTTVGDLEVRIVGEDAGGPTALLWHSLFADSRSWHRVEGDLAEDRRLVLVNGPGHGGSTDPGRRYTMEECADAAISILDHLGIEEPVDWVGNAWGGHVGVIAAVKHPERFRSLVAAGTPVHSYTGSGRIQTSLLLVVYRLFGPRRFLVDSVIDVLLSHRTRSRDPDAVALTRDSFVKAGGLANAVASISLRRPDLTPLLPKLAAPTLFITGTEHADWSPVQAKATSQLLPDGSVAVLEDSAYLSPLEAPGEFTRLVRDHWASHKPHKADA